MEFLLYCFAVWFFYYLINHASLFDRLRAAAMPALPVWIQKLISCALCFTFWLTAALSLFAGFSIVVFAAPPCVLFTELAYRKLTVSQPETSLETNQNLSESLEKQVRAAVVKQITDQQRPGGSLS